MGGVSKYQAPVPLLCFTDIYMYHTHDAIAITITGYQLLLAYPNFLMTRMSLKSTLLAVEGSMTLSTASTDIGAS